MTEGDVTKGMYMKKVLFMVLCLFAVQSLQAHEQHYMCEALTKITEETSKADGFYETALSYENLDKWFKLLVKLEIPAKQKQEILLDCRDDINFLSSQFLTFLEHLYDEDHETIPVQYNGESANAFVNLDKERFEQEKASYEKYSIFKPFLLDKKNLKKVKPKTCYNFVVSTQGEIILGDLQEYDELMEGDKKILLAPNHALLAKGESVMTAGEITLIGDREFKLWMIGMTSGHYHPASESKKYIVDALLRLGIPQEQIIVFGFQIHKLPWKLLEDDKCNQ